MLMMNEDARSQAPGCDEWRAALRRPAILLCGLALAAMAGAPSATAAPSANWVDYALIAKDRLTIGPGLNLNGSYAVTGVGGSLEIGTDSFQLDSSSPRFVVGDTLHLSPQASVVRSYTGAGGIVGHAGGTVRGPNTTVSFPVQIARPSFPRSAVCDGCAVSGVNDVVVQAGETKTLPAGCHGTLLARSGSTLRLQPGSHTFRWWDVRKFAEIIAEGPVQIHIREKLWTEEGTFLGPQSGQPLDFQVWIGSTRECNAWANPASSTIGKFSHAIGMFVAPHDDDFNLKKQVLLQGTAVAQQIHVRGDHAARPPTPTPSPSPTPSATPTFAPTAGPTPTATPSPTPSPTSTPIPTSPFIPPTPPATPTPSPTSTPIPTSPFIPPTPVPCYISPQHDECKL